MHKLAISSLVLGFILMVAAPVMATQQEVKFDTGVKTNVTCDGWSVTAEPSSEHGYTVKSVEGADQGDWTNGTSVDYTVKVTWKKWSIWHYVYHYETTTGTLVKPEDCTPIVTDVCPNIDEVQNEVPSGMHVDSEGNCVVDQTPVATPSATVLPNTGADTWALEALGVITTAFGWAVKRTLKG